MNQNTEYYKDTVGVIYIGDVFKVLKSLNSGIIQTCVTSPPYWGLRDYSEDGQLGLEKTLEEFIENMVNVFREVRRVLRDDGTLWLNIGDTMINKNLCGIPWLLAFALQADGWYLRSDIIWHKPAPMPESVTDRPTKSHEHIFLLTKKLKYFYDADVVRGNHNLRDVWTINTASCSFAHFATFPTALVDKCIMAGTPEKACSICGRGWERITEKKKTFESGSGKSGNSIYGKNGKKCQGGGDTGDIRKGVVIRVKTLGFRSACDCNGEIGKAIVLDPFGGTGTTAKRAKELGRKFIHIDISEKYNAYAKKRLKQEELF